MRQEVVTFQNGFHGPQFRVTRGTTHRVLVFPAPSNMVVESLVRHLMSLTVEYEYATHEGLGVSVGRCMGLFYVDGVIIGSRDLKWLQGGINYFIRLFRRVILMTNVSKSKTMTCHPGEICIGISKEAFSQSSKEEGSTYRECLRRRIPCPDCRVDLTARYMMDHCRKLHGAEPEIEWDQLLFSHPEHLPLVYEVRFPTKMQLC